MTASNRKPSKDGRVDLHIRLPPDLLKMLESAASENERSAQGEAVWRLRQSFGTKEDSE